jgi:hypothetical protein
VRQRVLVVADADADPLGSERPYAELDEAVVERRRAEAALPRQWLAGVWHPPQRTQGRAHGTRAATIFVGHAARASAGRRRAAAARVWRAGRRSIGNDLVT